MERGDRRNINLADLRTQKPKAVNMNEAARDTLSKVPEVTLGFWIIKILATTLGETGGDTVSMTMDMGYLIGTAIFLSILLVLVVAQIAAKKFRPFLYWSTIVASTSPSLGFRRAAAAIAAAGPEIGAGARRSVRSAAVSGCASA